MSKNRVIYFISCLLIIIALILSYEIQIKRLSVVCIEQENCIQEQKEVITDQKNNITSLHSEISVINTDNNSLKINIEELQKMNELLINENQKLKFNQDLSKQFLTKIDYLKTQNKKMYLTLYKNFFDETEYNSIYDNINSTDFDLFCRVVQAEIGNADFDSKCNVVSVIINRYKDNYYPNTWQGVLRQEGQFTCVENNMINEIVVNEDTILAIEYVWLVGDTASGATYFHANTTESEWHKNCLNFVLKDNYHTFYKRKGV